MKPKHLIEQRKRYGVTKEVAACSNVSFSRMVSDPAKVTCQRCQQTNIFKRLARVHGWRMVPKEPDPTANDQFVLVDAEKTDAA